MRIVSLCHHIRHRAYYVFAQGWLPRSQVTIDTLENRKSNEIFCPKGIQPRFQKKVLIATAIHKIPRQIMLANIVFFD